MTAPSLRDGGDWFPVSGLSRERTLVWLMVAGKPVQGYMKRGRKLASWWVPAADGRGYEKVPRHAEPTLFRPLDGVAWEDPLPPPAVLQPEPIPAYPAIRQRANLAPPNAPPLPAAIPYSPRGKISLAECEARILRAIKTDRALPDTDKAKMAVRANWPATSAGPGDYPPEINLKWRPFPEDVADYLTAMGWYARLGCFEQRLIKRRALGASFLRMAEEEGGRSHEWARQQYIAAITRAWVLANR